MLQTILSTSAFFMALGVLLGHGLTTHAQYKRGRRQDKKQRDLNEQERQVDNLRFKLRGQQDNDA
ncbi:hypothetical protein Acsp05_45530 [Actinokineospora sp. NBRC 105648]|nr:hypothetical protein Acsp05_45530 [Actinokineospora sp. NBRC 105648]